MAQLDYASRSDAPVPWYRPAIAGIAVIACVALSPLLPYVAMSSSWLPNDAALYLYFAPQILFFGQHFIGLAIGVWLIALASYMWLAARWRAWLILLVAPAYVAAVAIVAHVLLDVAGMGVELDGP